MNILSIIGFLLVAGVQVYEHLIHRISSKLAVVIYLMALALMISGLIMTRKRKQ